MTSSCKLSRKQNGSFRNGEINIHLILAQNAHQIDKSNPLFYKVQWRILIFTFEQGNKQPMSVKSMHSMLPEKTAKSHFQRHRCHPDRALPRAAFFCHCLYIKSHKSIWSFLQHRNTVSNCSETIIHLYLFPFYWCNINTDAHSRQRIMSTGGTLTLCWCRDMKSSISRI